MVYQHEPGTDQGLVVWAATGYYPQETVSIVPFQANVGLVYRGLIPGRKHDQTMLGLIYGRFSHDYAATVQQSGKGYPAHEFVLEAGHRFQIKKFAYVQPDLLWVQQPSGTGRIPNALVVGAPWA
jgi:porin